ncbi:MAG: protein TorT [Gammaproteobacteria bacterium]|jgi:protein TorT
MNSNRTIKRELSKRSIQWINLVCLLLFIVTYVFFQRARAEEKNWWPVKINVLNPACTSGYPTCWTGHRNETFKPELVDYIPLRRNEVETKHHICVSFPHMKDSYFAGVAYGVITEGERLGQKITLVEAGGYTNLEKQLNQVEDCIANGAEALVIAPISSDGNAKQIEVIRAAGIPVVVIITDINTAVDAYSIQSFYNMGYISCKWVADQHPAKSQKSGEKIKAVWFPGPPGAGWSVSGNKGCRDAVKGTSVEILETRWGDTGKIIQLELVENILQTMTSGEEVELDYIIGTATTIEGAVGSIRERGLQKQIKLVAYYYTPGMNIFLKRGSVAMAPSDQMITQARVAIDQAVRLLEDKKMATGGRPEFNNSDRLTEHAQPLIIIVTPDTVDNFDSSTTLAPKGWIPVFSVD